MGLLTFGLTEVMKSHFDSFSIQTGTFIDLPYFNFNNLVTLKPRRQLSEASRKFEILALGTRMLTINLDTDRWIDQSISSF